jgi:hypothetical protein
LKNELKKQELIISFKFSIFDLHIEHKILKELGEFTIFCMKAISNKMEIEDISDIIQIKREIIKKQLSFAISRKYLTDDFILTDKGKETVKLFEFINIFNEKKIKIALEHYIENNAKILYPADHKKFENVSSGYLVKDNLYDYKIQNKFDEIIEKDRTKIKDFLLKDFMEYETIIEKYLNDFIFRIEKNEKQQFYNYKINKDDFINKLHNIKNKNNSYISVNIPIVEINKIINSKILDIKEVKKIKIQFDKFKYFNLINGKPLQLETKKNNKNNNSNLEIKPLINIKDIVKNDVYFKEIKFNNFLYIDMETEIKEFDEIRFFDITKIMEEI